MFLADGRMEVQTDMTKLIAHLNFAKTSKKGPLCVHHSKY
jgi:hypothetical protein